MMAGLGSKNPKNLGVLYEAGEITKEEYNRLMEEHKERLKKKGKRKTGLLDMLRGK